MDGVEEGGRGILCAKRLVEGNDIDGCHTAGRFTQPALKLVLETLRAGLESAENNADTPLEVILFAEMIGSMRPVSVS